MEHNVQFQNLAPREKIVEKLCFKVCMWDCLEQQKASHKFRKVQAVVKNQDESGSSGLFCGC